MVQSKNIETMKTTTTATTPVNSTADIVITDEHHSVQVYIGIASVAVFFSLVVLIAILAMFFRKRRKRSKTRVAHFLDKEYTTPHITNIPVYGGVIEVSHKRSSTKKSSVSSINPLYSSHSPVEHWNPIDTMKTPETKKYDCAYVDMSRGEIKHPDLNKSFQIPHAYVNCEDFSLSDDDKKQVSDRCDFDYVDMNCSVKKYLDSKNSFQVSGAGINIEIYRITNIEEASECSKYDYAYEDINCFEKKCPDSEESSQVSDEDNNYEIYNPKDSVKTSESGESNYTYVDMNSSERNYLDSRNFLEYQESDVSYEVCNPKDNEKTQETGKCDYTYVDMSYLNKKHPYSRNSFQVPGVDINYVNLTEGCVVLRNSSTYENYVNVTAVHASVPKTGNFYMNIGDAESDIKNQPNIVYENMITDQGSNNENV